MLYSFVLYKNTISYNERQVQVAKDWYLYDMSRE